MTLKALGETVSKIVLAIVEYSLKCCAFLAVVITLGAKGSFLGKVMHGFTSLPAAFMAGPQVSQDFVDMGNIISDYNSHSIEEFTDIHGANAVDGVMQTFHEAVLFIENISQNIVDNSFTTLLASLIVFLTFFVGSLFLGFIRRSGNVPFKIRLEQQLWYKLFGEEKANEQATSEVFDEKSEPVLPNIDPEPVPGKSVDSALEEVEAGSVNTTSPPAKMSAIDDEQVNVDVQVNKNVNEYDENFDNPEGKQQEEYMDEIEDEETVETTESVEEKEADQYLELTENDKTATAELPKVEMNTSSRSALEKEINQAKQLGKVKNEEKSELAGDYSLQEYLQMARSSG